MLLAAIARTICIAAGISISRYEARACQSTNFTDILYPLDKTNSLSRLLMKGVHDHHISDARPKQRDIHTLLRKFSLNQAAGSCSGFYGLWYL